MSAYRELEARFRRRALLDEAAAVLHWDMSAMMPEGGAEARAEQLAILRRLSHESITDPALADLLPGAMADSALDGWQRANLREMRRDWLHAVAVPSGLVEELSRATSACETLWRVARAKADFGLLLPSFVRLVTLVRELAAAKADRLGLEPYDSLLDAHEPGRTAAAIAPLFDDLARFLPAFIDKVIARQAGERVHVPEGPFPAAAQRALGERLMAKLGFDFAHGRLDQSLHPFCGGVPEDVRVTTRYDEARFQKSLMAIFHETGHALYEQGLPKRWRRQPVGAARGMGVHESQSLVIEMQVCRGRPFLAFAAPLLREAYGGSGPAWEPDNLYRLYTRVERDFIRVDADEATYPLHVILRFRLERAIVEGRLEPGDLPQAWGEGMTELLGLTPADDGQGCLQDIHWYDGAWGYFPTYTLGAMMAAQLFEAATAAEPDVLAGVARGDFAPLLAWLRRNVHERASLLETDELMVEATGRPLDPGTFKRHLAARYLG
ncbi:MAG: carboxypeptidase M32 [Alphaproteobacteria bacterium]